MSSISTLLVLLQTPESSEVATDEQMKLQPAGGRIRIILHLNSHHLADIYFRYRKAMKKWFLTEEYFGLSGWA